MPLAGDWQRPRLARSVTLPILRWPDNRLQRTVRTAAAEPLGALQPESGTMKRTLGRKRNALILAVAGLLLIVTESIGLALPEERAGDRAQISAILSRWEEAWNRHDMHAFASQFQDDGVWILWTGDVWSGRDAIEQGHAAVHKTFFRNSVQRERFEELTFVGPDAAVVRFCSTLTGDERSPDKVVRSRKFLVLTKRQGVWMIGWGQNTRLVDTVPDSDCFIALREAGNGA